ncbi:MAG: sulfate permease [Deltaproteobacteria bacterium]|nr:sulfate permease [Deltaproteobacteria bacterium]
MPTRLSIAPRLRRWFTILQWLPSYGVQHLRGDLVSGLTVGAMLVPQAMAYALLAGVPPSHGLYACLVPLLVYPVFGTSRHLAVGIAALDMLIVGAAIARLAPQSEAEAIGMAISLTALAGGLQLLMGALRLGFLVELLSRPVITGFVAAAPILIGLGQLATLVGVHSPRASDLLALLWESARVLRTAHPLSALVGGLSVGLLVATRPTRLRAVGPLLLVIAATLASWLFALEVRGVPTVGAVARGLPSPTLPSLADARDLLPSAATLVLIQVMTVMSLGKALARTDGYAIRPNRELVALGLSNLAGSLFRALPISASFSRTALNTDAGARTPLSNAFAAGVVALGLTLLAGTLAHIPKPALAAIIMVASFGMVDLSGTADLFRLRRAEGYVALTTLASTLLIGVEEGVFIGVFASMLVLLYRQSRPHIAELGLLPGSTSFRDRERAPDAVGLPGYLILRVDGAITFSNAEFVRRDVLERLDRATGSCRAVIVDGRGVNDIDTTAMATLHSLLDALDDRGVALLLAHFKARPRDILERARIAERLAVPRLDLAPADLIGTFEAAEGPLTS